MHKLSNAIDYFKSCYQVDLRAISIFNFFGKKVEQQLILDNAQLLTGKLLQYPISTKWGEEMEKTLALHSQEKVLYCCAFFLSGKMNVIGKAQKVFAPLYIYPVSLLLENEIYYLVLDPDNAVINPVFVEFIKTQTINVDITYDDLANALPRGFIKFDEIFKIEKVLQKLIPELEVSDLDTFPQLHSEEEIKKIYKKPNRNNSLSLIGGMGVGLMPKPSGSRGILNELAQMTQQNDHADILFDLFFPNKKKKAKDKTRKIFTPVALSKNQLNVFHSCDKHQLSLVIGPPGTGKSFTIAALAVDLITRGKSVLIASKNNQAGNVIAKKIEKDFGLKGVVVKTASRSFKSTLERRLNHILYGFETSSIGIVQLNKLEKEVSTISKSIADIEKELLEREANELKWGNFFYQDKGSFFQLFQKALIKYRMSSKVPVWEMMATLENLTKQLHTKTKRFIKKRFEYFLYETLSNERPQMQTLLDALTSDTGNLMQEQFDKMDFNVALHALPAWIVNSSEVHKSLPLKKGLFDVVIIDEATQCDIASSLPLLQRAKKAIIVGDPKQLRHISFLSKKQQEQFSKKHNITSISKNKIDYRKSSLLDLVSSSIPSQDQVCFLNEHYRSMPDIIDFSNQHFYSNKLSVMTATPITLEEKNVFLHQTNGNRNTKGHNEKEAIAIIEKIKSIVEKEVDLTKRLCQTIGILSPFRSQVTYLKSQIRKAIDTKAITRHQILIGTPHQFQGEERDVMMLSFAVDYNSHPSTFLYLNKPDVFNVSITRARSVQHIFTSVSIDQLKHDYLFTKYLHHISASLVARKGLSTYQEIDDFMEEVVALLTEWKVDQIYKSYPIAGIEIDIVVVHRNKTYCIDLIGYPGDFEKSFPIEQWKMLNRMGVKTFSLPYSSWHIHRKESVIALSKFLF